MRPAKMLTSPTVRLGMDNLYQVHRHEQRIAVFLDLGALVPVAGVLDRQIVQPEFFLHFIELSIGRIAQRNPDQTAWLFKIFADILNGWFGKFDAVLVGNAIDQHGGLRPVMSARSIRVCVCYLQPPSLHL